MSELADKIERAKFVQLRTERPVEHGRPHQIDSRLTPEELSAIVSALRASDRDGWREAVREFIAAEDAVDAEARRAEQPGANAWSSAPVCRRIEAVKALRALLPSPPSPKQE